MIPKSVQVRLYTVIRTAANRYFEFVGRLHLMVAFIESGMYPVCQCKCVTQSILACGSFAETTGRTLDPVPPVSRPASATHSPERFNILIWNTRYLYCKTGCQCNMAVPVFLQLLPLFWHSLPPLSFRFW